MTTPAATPSPSNDQSHHWVSTGELHALRQKLREAQETLEAIQSGDVDAVVVSGDQGSQIYTLTGAEEPYRIFVEQMQEGAVTISKQGLILYCNKKFAEIVALPLEKVIGSALDMHLPPSTWEAIQAGISEGSPAAVKVEIILSAPGCEPLPVLITASRLESSGEEAMCLIVTDLSAQKRATAIQMAHEAAEAANRAKDTFLAVLSHELRTPLTPALMAASLLERDTKLSDQAREMVVMIRRNVEIETRLIDDLLDLTRITQGKIQLQMEPVDVHKVIQDSVLICKADLDDNAQFLHLDLQASDSRILGDPVRLQQILWNLIRNASKFSGRNKPIFIATHNDAEGRLKIVVRDEGVGIDPEVIPRLFNPFEQGTEEITRKFGGLGLGLVISKSIAEMHEGGSINASSPGLDKGSCFELTFTSIGPASLPKPPPVDVQRPKILLVEDNPDSRLMMAMLLESLGYSVEKAKDFQSARDILARAAFDLVVSDLGLPDGNGYQVMREALKYRIIPGIAVSGFGQREDVMKSMDAGFTSHLVKPVAPAALESAVQHALQNA